MARGRFIAIEGTDGSGKATQAALLARTLQRQGRTVHIIAFPQHGKPSAAPVDAYLTGKYGSLTDVGPYQASMLYAVDRFAAKQGIMNWLRRGHIVLADRYLASNMAHQGAKIASLKARKKFWKWIEELEYSLMGIPRPDMTVVLTVPTVVSRTLVLKKKPRAYLQRHKRDIHERNTGYQRRVLATYRELARFDRGMRIVECTDHGVLLGKSDVHRRVMETVGKYM